jgi:hypothetical protein
VAYLPRPLLWGPECEASSQPAFIQLTKRRVRLTDVPGWGFSTIRTRDCMSPRSAVGPAAGQAAFLAQWAAGGTSNQRGWLVDPATFIARTCVSVARACSRRHLRMWRSGARLGHCDNTLQEFTSRCGCDRQPACRYGGPAAGNITGALERCSGVPEEVNAGGSRAQLVRVALIP